MASVSYRRKAEHARTEKPRNPCKITALERNNMQWEAHKDKIRSLYVDQDMTLKATMAWFEVMHEFVKSERKWKEKVKQWGFEKDIPAHDMNFMVAKADKRKAEGKETIFYRCGTLVDESRIEQFKRRRIISPRNNTLTNMPETPPHIYYDTPTTVKEFEESEGAVFDKLLEGVSTNPYASFEISRPMNSLMSEKDQIIQPYGDAFNHFTNKGVKAFVTKFEATKTTVPNLPRGAKNELQKIESSLRALKICRNILASSWRFPETFFGILEVLKLQRTLFKRRLLEWNILWEPFPFVLVYEAAQASLIHQYTIRSLVEQILHLRLLEDWPTLLSTMRCVYRALEVLGPGSHKEFCSTQILLVKSILLSIPRPFGQHIPLKEVEEILYLDNKFFGSVTISPPNLRGPRALGWVEEEEMALEDDASASDEESNSNEEEEVVMGDMENLVAELESSMESRNSQRYGETYTESADSESKMMGITFDYSNLFE